MILLTTKLDRFINFKTNTIFTSDILRKVKVKRSKKKSFFVKKNISSNLVKQENKVANATIMICCEKKVKNTDLRENGINLNIIYISRKKKTASKSFFLVPQKSQLKKAVIACHFETLQERRSEGDGNFHFNPSDINTSV